MSALFQLRETCVVSVVSRSSDGFSERCNEKNLQWSCPLGHFQGSASLFHVHMQLIGSRHSCRHMRILIHAHLQQR